MQYVQLEFDFGAVESPGKSKRKKIDYEKLFAKLKEKPLTFAEIQELTGLSKEGTSQCITTLTLNYPVWNPTKGLYKVCEPSDYTTVDWSKLYAE